WVAQAEGGLGIGHRDELVGVRAAQQLVDLTIDALDHPEAGFRGGTVGEAVAGEHAVGVAAALLEIGRQAQERGGSAVEGLLVGGVVLGAFGLGVVGLIDLVVGLVR